VVHFYKLVVLVNLYFWSDFVATNNEDLVNSFLILVATSLGILMLRFSRVQGHKNWSEIVSLPFWYFFLLVWRSSLSLIVVRLLVVSLAMPRLFQAVSDFFLECHSKLRASFLNYSCATRNSF